MGRSTNLKNDVRGQTNKQTKILVIKSLQYLIYNYFLKHTFVVFRPQKCLAEKRPLVLTTVSLTATPPCISVAMRETNMPLEALLQVGTHLPISLMWPSFPYIFQARPTSSCTLPPVKSH